MGFVIVLWFDNQTEYISKISANLRNSRQKYFDNGLGNRC